MKALVTGATGIVGANLVRALLRASHDVRVLVRPTSDLRALAGLAIERCEGDVMRTAGLADAAHGCDIVFHAAATFTYWGQSFEDQKDLAVRGTRNIVTAARTAGASRVVVTSSSVTLGSRATPTVLEEADEFDEPQAAAYTRSKLAQERAAFETGAALGIEVVAVCPTLVVGANDYRLSPSNAYIVNYLNDPLRSTFLGGCNIVSAEDVAAGHIIAGLHGVPGCRYAAGSDNLEWRQVHRIISELTGTFGPSVTLNHTAAYLAAAATEASARLTGTRPVVTRDEARMAGRFYWYSSERLARLGYQPKSTRAALATAIAWLLGRSVLNDSVASRLALEADVRDAKRRIDLELVP